MSDHDKECVGHLGEEQDRTLNMMRANPVPWCLHKRMAAGLLRRGLIVQSGVCCKEHNDPMFSLAPESAKRAKAQPEEVTVPDLIQRIRTLEGANQKLTEQVRELERGPHGRRRIK